MVKGLLDDELIKFINDGVVFPVGRAFPSPCCVGRIPDSFPPAATFITDSKPGPRTWEDMEGSDFDDVVVNWIEVGVGAEVELPTEPAILQTITFLC